MNDDDDNFVVTLYSLVQIYCSIGTPYLHAGSLAPYYHLFCCKLILSHFVCTLHTIKL